MTSNWDNTMPYELKRISMSKQRDDTDKNQFTILEIYAFMFYNILTTVSTRQTLSCVIPGKKSVSVQNEV